MKYLNILICIAAFLYVAVRTITVGITFDEVWTINAFAKESIADIVAAIPPYANNHILNTLLVKCCLLFSDCEFVIRLPNLLAAALYIFSVYQISNILTSNKVLRISLLVSLLSSYTLLHFFGLCRGYGLGIGLMTYGIYNAMLFANHFKARNVHLSLIAGFLAAYANFTLTLPFACLLAICTILLFGRYLEERKQPQSIALPMLYAVVTTPALIIPIRAIKQSGEMYYGGDRGFYEDTVTTLMRDYFGHTQLYTNPDMVNMIYIALTCIAIAISVILFVAKRKISAIMIPSFMLLGTVILMILQVQLLDSKYVISRGSLFMFPLTMLTIGSLWIIFPVKAQRSTSIPAIIFALIGVYNLVNEANFYTTREWWDECYNKDVIQFIAQHERDANLPISLYTSFALDNSLNYYATRKYPSRFKNIEPNHGMDDSILVQYDYVYLPVHAYKVPKHLPLKPVLAYQDSTYILYRNTTR